MQRVCDNIVGALLAIMIMLGVAFAAISVFLLRYGFFILAIGFGVWLGLSWFN